jgi:hypothetical protein
MAVDGSESCTGLQQKNTSRCVQEKLLTPLSDTNPTRIRAPHMNSHLFSITFAALFTLTLSACGSDDGSTTPVTPPSNSAPIVDAGADQSVAEDVMVQLSPTVSDTNNDALTFSWSRISGPYMQFSDSMAVAPSFIAPDVASSQDIVLELSVSDGTETVTDRITVSVSPAPENPIVSTTFNGALMAADYWAEEPMILSAGMGFDNIITIPEITESAVRDAGGSWFSAACTNGDVETLTTATPQDGTANVIKGHSSFDDGLPIVFSWPVALETADVSDFQFTLNTGEIVFPNAITLLPNWELNERNVIVAFGDFGNRGLRSEADAVFPVRLDIVEDATPLTLVGPGAQEVSAVGLHWTTDRSAYDTGPVLVGAKLNAVGNAPLGEGGIPVLIQNSGVFPNDEFALYGGDADYRLRVLTTGGFSPDGLRALTPDSYESFFRVHARGANGQTVLLENVGQDYQVAGGTLRILGLADLGQRSDPVGGIYYDDCYNEDRDNYIDIILAGDEAAARNVTFVEIPGLEGGYSAFFNPGGPGPTPFNGVRYTAPGPADLEPVIIALDDPMRVSRSAR